MFISIIYFDYQNIFGIKDFVLVRCFERFKFDILLFHSEVYDYYKEIKGDYKMLEKVKNIIADQLGLKPSEITLTSNFKEDLGADSLDLTELVMMLEDEYSIDIPVDDMTDIITVEDILNYLKDKGIDE